MKSKPITQKAKNSPFKINEALIRGAAEASKKFTDIGEAFTEGTNGGKKPKMTKKTKGEDTTETIKTPKKSLKQAYADRSGEYKNLSFEEYAKIAKADPLYGTSGSEKTIIIKGEDEITEVPYSTYDYGDALTSPQQRGVNRGMLKDVRMSGKMARKLARFEGKSPKERRQAAKDAKKEAMKNAIAAQKAFAQTQRDAAEQGIAPGSMGRSKVQMSGKMDKYSREMGWPDFSESGQEDVFNKMNTEQDNSGINMNKKTPFKMSGYGKKTYKK